MATCTEKELSVIYKFLETGKRRDSFKSVYYGSKKDDTYIYRWFQRPIIKNKIRDIGIELDLYNEFTEMKLLSIMKDENASNKDKIMAVRTWNEIRKRIKTEINIENNIDFKNITDETLNDIVNKILLKDKKEEE